MSFLKELSEEIGTIFKTKWESRAGEIIPEAEDVQLGNDAVLLDGTVLYADLADSSGLVERFKSWFAAEVYKAYLVTVCRVIRENGGSITAFDGDRAMAVYIGKQKNTSAVRTALQINYLVEKVINPKIAEAYPKSPYAIRQSVGIDSSELFVARTGIRGANDLVWVGNAANRAAKMCSLRDSYYTSFITKKVFDVMSESVKFGGNPKQPMWEKFSWDEKGIELYRSSWWSRPG